MEVLGLFIGWQRIRQINLPSLCDVTNCDNLIYYSYLYNLIFLPAPVLILLNT